MKIYRVALIMVRGVYALAKKVQQHDPDLARQMRRSSSSVVLNMSEGWHSRAGNRIARFDNAMGSARETVSNLELCVAVGLLSQAEVDPELDRLDHCVATLWNLNHRL